MRKSIHSAEQKILQAFLKELREGKGILQKDFAVQIERPASYVSRYENGEKMLDLPELRQICEALGITLVEFVQSYEARLAELKTDR